ncbi:MAG TPA: class I SAM-dependent methyltransferase [Devosia sp.]
MADGLYDDPDLYDLVAPRDPEMEAFYVRMAGGGAVRVLELACGTGRLTAPVAASGARIVAADVSEVMLEAARANLGELPNVRYVQLDMRDFDLGERFERVMIAANSLLHLTEPGALLSGLRATARHLEPRAGCSSTSSSPTSGCSASRPETVSCWAISTTLHSAR